MLIRPMAPADAGDVAALLGQLGYPSSRAQVARRLDLLAGDPEHALFVAERAESRVVGWVHVHAVRLMEADPRAEVWGLVVDADHQRRGVGRALMRQAERWAAEKGYRAVRLRSNVVRAEAHRFYHGLGYAITKTSYTLEKTLPGELIARPHRLVHGASIIASTRLP
jgi:GNAT superfamily N-acetyltransferase